MLNKSKTNPPVILTVEPSNEICLTPEIYSSQNVTNRKLVSINFISKNLKPIINLLNPDQHQECCLDSLKENINTIACEEMDRNTINSEGPFRISEVSEFQLDNDDDNDNDDYELEQNNLHCKFGKW